MYICPHCKQEIAHVLRFLVYEVGDAYNVDDRGVVDPGNGPDPTTLEDGVETNVMNQVEGEDIRYECPKCGQTLELREWPNDGDEPEDEEEEE